MPTKEKLKKGKHCNLNSNVEEFWSTFIIVKTLFNYNFLIYHMVMLEP